MLVFNLTVLDKNGRESDFKEGFLLANMKPDIVLGMLYLTMSNANVDF